MSAAPLAAVARLPAEPGVYRFRDGGGRILYVGRATDLRARVRSYWGDLGGRSHLAPMVGAVARVEALSCASTHEAAWLERNLLERSLPPWNRTAGGAEVPVYVRLDAAADAPSLLVVHGPVVADGARWFGPYLGGLRIRTAVSALERVLPLAYTGAGVRGFGADFARRLGVAAGQRAAMAQTIEAVLGRDPDALALVRQELIERRDRAGSGLAFERAARWQAGLEAVDWMVAEQHAAVMDPVDADVAGWSDGVLVRLEIRGGRMSGWTQRRAGRAAGEAAMSASSWRWVAFARRNAELAARLLDRAARSDGG